MMRKGNVYGIAAVKTSGAYLAQVLCTLSPDSSLLFHN